MSRPALLALLLALPIPAAQTDDVQKAVVKISATVSPPNMSRPWEMIPPSNRVGSGVVIEGRRILTNAHVVAHAQQIYVQPNRSSERLAATVEVLAPDCDLALLKLDDPQELAEVKPLPLADALPPLKSKVSVHGYPTGGDAISVTEGVVSRIEFASYFQGTGALRIQVDAAVNPGNSGGPGVIDGKVTGIVFSLLREAENVGYLIPAEVVRHFLEDWRADGKYDGFPRLDLGAATLENPAVRAYLKLDRKDSGVVVHRVDLPEVAEKLKPWDVIAEVEGRPVDNLGMIEIEEGVRVGLGAVISRKPAGSLVKLKVIRKGERLEVEVPTFTRRNGVIQRMAGKRPSYFVYGGLVFSPVTQEMLSAAGDRMLTILALNDRLIPQHLHRVREAPDQELVATCQAVLPHRLTKGYQITPYSVVTHVNDAPVRNLRHLLALVKEGREKEFIILRFEGEREEKVVLDPREVDKATPEILRNNNIPSVCSDDLKDLWP